MFYIGIAIGIIATIIILVLILAAMKPDQFRIERSKVIKSSPETVFGFINSVSEWRKWSPWEKYDPNIKVTISGPESGVGSRYSWEGNGKVGAGSMEVIESNPSSQVKLNLLFERPFKCNNTAIFTLTPQNGQTHVNWVMEGKSVFMSKVFQVICNMDKMVGKDFEEGLENLSKQASKS